MRYNEYINKYVDLYGNPVQRTPKNYPYSYSPYVVYKSDNFNFSANTIYSDRMMQSNLQKFNKCIRDIWNSAGHSFDNRHYSDIEKFLSIYLNKSVKLTAILKGCNYSTGYPYWIFKYEEPYNKFYFNYFTIIYEKQRNGFEECTLCAECFKAKNKDEALAKFYKKHKEINSKQIVAIQ